MNKNQSKCQKCGAPILWIEDKNGRNIAVGELPSMFYQVKEGIGELIEVYALHWTTCRGKKGA